MNWDVLGPFSSTSCPNEINIRKIQQLNNQMIIRETSLDPRRDVEHFRLFSVFLAAGLVVITSESLIFSNASNSEKDDVTLL